MSVGFTHGYQIRPLRGRAWRASAGTTAVIIITDMATAKDHIAQVIKRQPDDSSYDQIIRELAFDLMVQRRLRDSEDRRTIRNEEIERRIKTWQK